MIANYMITPYKSQRCVQNGTFFCNSGGDASGLAKPGGGQESSEGGGEVGQAGRNLGGTGTRCMLRRRCTVDD